MHGCRAGYKRLGNRHSPYSAYSPLGCRVFRTVAIVVITGALAIVMVQGCRGQLEAMSKKFSSPSSGMGRRYVLASCPFFQPSSRNYLSASANTDISSDRRDVGSLDSAPSDGKAALSGAVSSGSIDELLDAIALVESNNRANAVGDGGSAVGAYQIRPIFLRDINRILGWEKYELDDRWDRQKSRAMARVYLDHYGRGRTLIEMARQYNGGPRGHLKEATKPFAVKILAAMDPAEPGHGGPF